jgi:hypothetical protein
MDTNAHVCYIPHFRLLNFIWQIKGASLEVNLRLCQYEDDVRNRRTARSLEERDRGPLKVLFQHIPGVSEKNHEKLRRARVMVEIRKLQNKSTTSRPTSSVIRVFAADNEM